MCRDGRKLRFFYHASCFTGSEDPRTQTGSSFEERKDYHLKQAPALSSLEGPRACRDADGRILGREVFKPTAPIELRHGKWSTTEGRGYKGPAIRTSVNLSGKDSLTEFISSNQQQKGLRGSDPGQDHVRAN